jgi:putative transcriptional regulator
MRKGTASRRKTSPPRPKSPKAVERAARADRDAQPLTETDLKRMRRTPQAKIIRRALDLTQEEFAARYHIPLGTLRDWEQGRAEPDQPARAYLTLIARDPAHVDRTLNPSKSDLARIDRMRDADIDYSDIPPLDRRFSRRRRSPGHP